MKYDPFAIERAQLNALRTRLDEVGRRVQR